MEGVGEWERMSESEKGVVVPGRGLEGLTLVNHSTALTLRPQARSSSPPGDLVAS